MKSTVTDIQVECVLCGAMGYHDHHLICGTANRNMSEKFGLKVPLCARCHDFIHAHGPAMRLSKMLGQAIFERNYYRDLYYELNQEEDEARARFRELFGKSYL